MKRILITVLILAWLSGTIWFLNKENGNADFKVDDVPIVAIGEITGESYSSVFYKGEKIGYSASVKQNIGEDLMWQETSYMRLPVGGVVQEVSADLTIVTNKQIIVKSFTFNFSSDEYKSSVSGVIDENILILTIRTPESSSKRNINLPGPIYMPSAVTYIAANDDFQKKQYTLPVFDPMTMTMRKYTVKISSKGNSPRGDKNVWKLYGTYNEYSTEMWVDSLGNIVMEKAASGFITYKESKDDALKFDLATNGSFDLLTQFSIPFKNSTGKKIDSPRTMKARLKGFDPSIFEFTDFNQAFDPDECILTVYSRGIDRKPGKSESADSTYIFSVEGINGYFIPPNVNPEDTMETPLIQKNDRRIIQLAGKITKDDNTDTEKLKSINLWLFKNIKKDYRSSIPSAIDVMRKKVGDCNEHTTLFTALARSIDIPCRVNIGIVHLNGAFYYHAWPQCFADGKWQTFEPTYGETIANAAHIKLLHGSINKQIEIMRLNKPEIEVIEINENYDFENSQELIIATEELNNFPCFTRESIIDSIFVDSSASERIQ